jgi:hypothetical protein
MRTSLSRATVLISGAALLALPACSDSSEPSAEEGSVRFAYAGALSGSLLATGPASNAFDPLRAFAVAFRSGAGELQLCAYQPTGHGRGNFLLLNAGVLTTPGEYNVPPTWAEGATSYQPGTFLVGVDASRSEIEQVSTFADGLVRADDISVRRVRGTFTVRTLLTTLEGGVFDVPLSRLADLPVLCS